MANELPFRDRTETADVPSVFFVTPETAAALVSRFDCRINEGRLADSGVLRGSNRC
jgi:hypothetical protein